MLAHTHIAVDARKERVCHDHVLGALDEQRAERLECPVASRWDRMWLHEGGPPVREGNAVEGYVPHGELLAAVEVEEHGQARHDELGRGRAAGAPGVGRVRDEVERAGGRVVEELVHVVELLDGALDHPHVALVRPLPALVPAAVEEHEAVAGQAARLRAHAEHPREPVTAPPCVHDGLREVGVGRVGKQRGAVVAIRVVDAPHRYEVHFSPSVVGRKVGARPHGLGGRVARRVPPEAHRPIRVDALILVRLLGREDVDKAVIGRSA